MRSDTLAAVSDDRLDKFLTDPGFRRFDEKVRQADRDLSRRLEQKDQADENRSGWRRLLISDPRERRYRIEPVVRRAAQFARSVAKSPQAIVSRIRNRASRQRRPAVRVSRSSRSGADPPGGDPDPSDPPPQRWRLSYFRDYVVARRIAREVF